jgi:hypothetical protein
MKFADRKRDHEENHKRTVEQQILDALLRIEELMQLQTTVAIEAPPEEVIAAKPDGVVKAKGKNKDSKYL